MNLSYEGIGYLAVTIPSITCVAGQLCKLNLVGQGEVCKDGDPFFGFVERVTEYRAAVQIEGFLEVSYTGPTPACGYTKLSSNGNGGVKLDDAGREYLVVDLKSSESKITIKL